jgi:Ulp1 family protease
MPRISKKEINLGAAINTFTAVITIINYPKDHWVTLPFNLKEQVLEVFDSMAPKHAKQRMENIAKVRCPQ